MWLGNSIFECFSNKSSTSKPASNRSSLKMCNKIKILFHPKATIHVFFSMSCNGYISPNLSHKYSEISNNHPQTVASFSEQVTLKQIFKYTQTTTWIDMVGFTRAKTPREKYLLLRTSKKSKFCNACLWHRFLCNSINETGAYQTGTFTWITGTCISNYRIHNTDIIELGDIFPKASFQFQFGVHQYLWHVWYRSTIELDVYKYQRWRPGSATSRLIL